MSDSGWPEATALASLAGALAIIYTPWAKESDPWTAAGAVATFIASAVALRIASGQERARRYERMEAAIAYRWIFGSEVSALSVHLTEIRDIALGITCSEGREITLEGREFLRRLSDLVELPMLHANSTEIVKFQAPIPEALGAIIGFLPGIKRALAALIETPNLIDQKTVLLAGSLVRRIDNHMVFIHRTGWLATQAASTVPIPNNVQPSNPRGAGRVT